MLPFSSIVVDIVYIYMKLLSTTIRYMYKELDFYISMTKDNKSARNVAMVPMLGIIYPDSKVYGANAGPSGADRAKMGAMLAPWTLPSGYGTKDHIIDLKFRWQTFLLTGSWEMIQYINARIWILIITIRLSWDNLISITERLYL